MINKTIINAVLNSATQESKDKVLNELLNHISLSYDYADNKAGHILEMLCDTKSIIKVEDVNLNYIDEHLGLLIYNHERFNIRNIKVESVDNIECSVKVTFEYLEKINEDRNDVSYTSSYTNIYFIDTPDILKK